MYTHVGIRSTTKSQLTHNPAPCKDISRPVLSSILFGLRSIHGVRAVIVSERRTSAIERQFYIGFPSLFRSFVGRRRQACLRSPLDDKGDNDNDMRCLEMAGHEDLILCRNCDPSRFSCFVSGRRTEVLCTVVVASPKM